MPAEDEEARRRRAEQIRKQVEEIESGEADDEPEAESPRDYVDRKMRERERAEEAEEGTDQAPGPDGG